MFARPCIGRLTSPFGWRKHPITFLKSWHQGVDLAQKGNVPIYAAADGTISRVGKLGTYGNVVMVLHTINGKTYETNYAHLHSYDVKVGQRVLQGQKIGRMGNTGSSTAQHLHFEIHVGRWATGQPNAVDPMLYITTVPALGAIGSDVEELQWLLNKHGYNLIVDGHHGTTTDDALRDFQKKNILPVDGKAGPATIGKLKIPVVTAPPKKEEEVLEDKEKNARADKSFQSAQDFVKANEISDGTYPRRPITRQEVWAMIERMDRTLKK